MSRLFSHKSSKSHYSNLGNGVSKSNSSTTFRQLYEIGKFTDDDLLQAIQSFAKISKFQKLDYSYTTNSTSKSKASQPTVIKREMLMIECHHKVLTNDSIDILLLALEIFQIRIQNLIISHCGLNDDVFILLHQSILCLPNLQLLDLSQNILTSISIQAIHEYATHPTSNKLFQTMIHSLIILDLRQNHKYIYQFHNICSNITVQDGLTLFQLFQETVEVLNGMEIQSVKENYQIQKMNYDNQKLFTESEIGILYSLLIQENMTHIHELSLQNNHIDSIMLSTLCTHLISPDLPYLQRLDLSYNPLLTPPKSSLLGMKTLVKRCRDNIFLIDIRLDGIAPHLHASSSSSSSMISSSSSSSIALSQQHITNSIPTTIGGHPATITTNVSHTRPPLTQSLTQQFSTSHQQNQSQASLSSTQLTISDDNDQESIAMSQTTAATTAAAAVVISATMNNITSSNNTNDNHTNNDTNATVIPVMNDSSMPAELMLKLSNSLAVNRSLSHTSRVSTGEVTATATRRVVTGITDAITSNTTATTTTTTTAMTATIIDEEKEYSDNRFMSFLNNRFQQQQSDNNSNNNNNNNTYNNNDDGSRYQTNITDTTKNHTIMSHSSYTSDHNHNNNSNNNSNNSYVAYDDNHGINSAAAAMKSYTNSLYVLDGKFCTANQLSLV